MLSSILFFIEIREMVNFELGEEIKKDVFRLVTSMGQSPNKESKPQTFSEGLRFNSSGPHPRDKTKNIFL